MKIRTQFLITMAVFGVALLGISVSVIITGQQVAAAAEQEKIANSVAQGASELSYLSNDYLIYRESQQLSRWQARFASFSAQVSALHVERPEQQVHARNIQASQRRMKEVFDSIVSGAGSASQNQELDPAFLQVSWSRMAVQSQGLVSDASRLSQLLREQADETRQANMVVVVAMMSVFGAYFLVNYLIVQRRLLASIAALKWGTLVIGSGDLDFRIPEQRHDEIGELSRAFNQMSVNLRAVTASKADLEREIAWRRRVEEERERLLDQVQAKNEELQAQSEEIRAANQELQARSEDLSEANEELRLAIEELERATATAEEAVRARDEFLSVAAHELKTPVTSLRGFAQLILRRHEKGVADDHERLSRALETIDRQSDKLASMVSKLLDISRLQGGRLTLERQWTDVVQLVEEVAAAARLKTAVHDIAIEVPPRAEAFLDPLRIEQVLTNLVDNAIRYSPNGGPIKISVAVDGDTIEIAVRDQGIGIPPEHRERVFERFYRADTAQHVPGLGLGLYISSQIVELHSGRIGVDCPPGGGTRIAVTLPWQAPA